MKNFTNKGFLLVETLVVATFCVTVLVMLFLQFRTLVVNYNNSYKYNTVEGIYTLDNMKKMLNQHNFKMTSGNYVTIGIDNSNKCTFSGSYTIASTFNKDFCGNLYKISDIKFLVYVKDSGNFSSLNISGASDGMNEFKRKLEAKGDAHRLIAEFNDGTYASITYNN